MKKLPLIFLLFVFCQQSFSQAGGPDAFGYTWIDNTIPSGPTYNWVDITNFPGAVQVAGLTDDNTTAMLPIGFQFPYYWYTVSQFKIGSNGYLIFNNGAISSPFPVIPSATLPNDIIAPFMCDLNFLGAGNTAQCWYWSNNSDSLIVSFIEVPFWINANPPYTGVNTFQVILSKADSSITFQYETQGGTSPGTGNFLSIGIENNSGAIGLQQSLNIYPTMQYAVKFYYPAATTFVVNDAAIVSNNNPETGGLFLSANSDPFTMTTQVENTGNQPLNPFKVNMSVRNSANVLQVLDSVTTTALAVGQTEDLVASNTFSPVTPGAYSFRSSTRLSGDATPSNNDKVLELQVVDTTQNFITLSYTGNVAAPVGAGISWTGGNAGVGVEFRPPFYPCFIRQVEVFITANASAAGFTVAVLDNTGPGNSAGALLDSVNVPAGQVLFPNLWNTVTMNGPIQVDTGSVFIQWNMNGNGIAIGTDTTGPISNRTYEILGSWSIFRYRENRDLMIRAIVSTSPTTGIEKPTAAGFIGEFYPSPAFGKISIDFNLEYRSGEMIFEFYNLEGQLVSTKKRAQVPNARLGSLSFDVSDLSSGAYVCKITDGKNQYNRKLIIGR